MWPRGKIDLRSVITSKWEFNTIQPYRQKAHDFGYMRKIPLSKKCCNMVLLEIKRILVGNIVRPDC